jgi:hypothetical protein
MYSQLLFIAVVAIKKSGKELCWYLADSSDFNKLLKILIIFF